MYVLYTASIDDQNVHEIEWKYFSWLNQKKEKKLTQQMNHFHVLLHQNNSTKHLNAQ